MELKTLALEQRPPRWLSSVVAEERNKGAASGRDVNMGKARGGWGGIVLVVRCDY